jgi:TolB-like protein
MSLFKELKRRNVFRVAAAYIIVGWLIMQVGEVLSPALLLPDWINSALAFFIILGFPLALFFAWAFELTPEGLKKEKDVDRSESITHVTGRKLNATIIALLVLALGYFAVDKFVLDPRRDAELVSVTQEAAQQTFAATAPVPDAPDDNSIAVLPFVNMSDDAANEFFSDGITEELLNLLAKIPELRVTSRSSAFSFKGQNIDIPTVADKLNVKHVLEGSVRKAGNRVRITAQLIAADSDVHIWSETFDRELDDIFAIQDEIAREVVTVLQLQLLGKVPEAAETSSKAYALYLQGKHFMTQFDPAGTEASAAAFRQAIEIDPEYAPAWAGLARIQRWRANWGHIDLHTGTEEARQAAHRALELDDTLADAWAILAHIQWVYDWNWDQSEGTARTALMHGPNDARSLEVAARIANTLGHFDDGLKYAQAAAEVDPLDPTVLRTLAVTHWARHEFVEQQRVYERVRDLYPERGTSWSNIAFALIAQGLPEAALSLVQNEASEVFVMGVKAYAYHDLDRQEDARRALQFVVDNDADWLAYQIAETYAYMNEIEAAFGWLETAYEMRDGGITYLVGDPTLKNLHGDPRWEALLVKTGLLDAWKQAQRWYDEAGS